MSAKLLMRWDIRPEKESEYFEFLVHEFIPALNRLGVEDILVWYTAYGDCEQKLAEGTAESVEAMTAILDSEEWVILIDKLQNYALAQEDLDDALRLNPKHAEALHNRGCVFLDQGDPAQNHGDDGLQPF